MGDRTPGVYEIEHKRSKSEYLSHDNTSSRGKTSTHSSSCLAKSLNEFYTYRCLIFLMPSVVVRERPSVTRSVDEVLISSFRGVLGPKTNGSRQGPPVEGLSSVGQRSAGLPPSGSR